MHRARGLASAVVLALAVLAAGCPGGARGPRGASPSPTEDPTAEWTLTLDSHDRISVRHVENLLRRSGITPDSMGVGSFSPRSWGFSGENARRARAALTADPSWPEIESRQGGIFSLVKRLEGTPPVIRDESVEAAIAWLEREHSAAAAVLRDEAIVRFGDGRSSFPGRARDERLGVASMSVLDREYLGEDGRRLKGCEVRVEMRTKDDRWGREWTGQVMSARGGWALVLAEGGEGDRRPR